MNKQDLLLEIGLEEMPARFVTAAVKQLEDKLTAWLKEKQISVDSVKVYSTPRRLTVFAAGVAEGQKDVEEEARGPAKTIAVDEGGNWTKAAMGFARGQGVTEKDLYFKEIKGREYVFVNKFIKGQETMLLLPQLSDLVTSMVFPKSMRWNSYKLRFIRPIKWLLVLYGDTVVPLGILNVSSGNKTFGHRFLGEEITVEAPAKYEELLLEQFVIADSMQRKEAIRQQLHNLAEDEGWNVPVDEDLLEEVNNLVEYPTALYGSFEKEFLSLPEEVLITTMREHQRYFPVLGEEGKLLPYFVTVRNGDHKKLDQVAKGNEKVLRARLQDAQFFYEEDRKKTVDEAVRSLDNVVFQEDLGSIGDKVRRIRKLSGDLAEHLQFEEKMLGDIDRSAEICKFDLVTYMVDEFPELQGIMGKTYARLKGENEVVAAAVKEHYMPKHRGDQLPGVAVGAVVAIADKMDTIAGCFAIGIIPSGSQDPYGLRRGASGIVQILLDRGWDITLETIIEYALDIYKKQGLLKREFEDVSDDMLEFFKLRVKTQLQESDVRYDVIDAVLSDHVGYVDYLANKADVMMEHVQEGEFKELVEALSRVTNIAKKAGQAGGQPNPSLFETSEEQTLYQASEQLKQEITEAQKGKDATRAYQALVAMKKPIHGYFDNVMVMAEEETVKNNRLLQMSALSKTIKSFADFNAVVL